VEVSMTLRHLIDTYGADDDDAQAAKNVLTALLRDYLDLAELMLLPVVHDEIRRLRRNRNRRAEDRAFKDGDPSGADPLAPLRALRNRSFLDPVAKVMVTWGAATPSQHDRRADWLLHTKIAPLQRSVERHRYAAQMLRAAKVACLNELEEYVPPDGTPARPG